MEQVKKEFVSDEKAKKIALHVSGVSVAGNVLLSLFKLLAGIIGHSGAMISDAVHSASDVFGTIIAVLGVSISKRKSDADHQYGHDRLECVAAIVLAVILLATGLGIGISGLEKIIKGNSGDAAIPGVIALVAAVVSIVFKEWMYWYTRAAAKKINSGALMAEALASSFGCAFVYWRICRYFGSKIGISYFRPYSKRDHLPVYRKSSL